MNSNPITVQSEELTSWDIWDGRHITHIALCEKHSIELTMNRIYDMTYRQMCLNDHFGHEPQDFCDWCESAYGK